MSLLKYSVKYSAYFKSSQSDMIDRKTDRLTSALLHHLFGTCNQQCIQLVNHKASGLKQKMCFPTFVTCEEYKIEFVSFGYCTVPDLSRSQVWIRSCSKTLFTPPLFQRLLGVYVDKMLVILYSSLLRSLCKSISIIQLFSPK